MPSKKMGSPSPKSSGAMAPAADALDPNDISTLMNLTRMAIELKQKDKALACQERLRKLPKGGPAADSFTSAMQKL